MATLADSQRPGDVGPPSTTGTTATPTQTPAEAQLAALSDQLSRLEQAANAPLGSDGYPTPEAFLAQQQLPKILTQWRQAQALVDKEKATSAKAASPRAPTQVGTNTSDKTITYVDANGQVISVDNPNYVAPAPKTADEKPFFIPGPGGQGLVPATAAEYTAYANSAAKDQANQTAQARLQSQIQSQTDQATLAQLRDNLLLLQAQGKIDDTKAAELFKEKYDQMTFDAAQKQLDFSNQNTDLLTQNTLQNSAFQQQATQQANAFSQQNALMQTGLTAGNDAVAAAQAGLQGAVGPGFGANFAAGLTAAAQGNPAGVKYGAGDFTTPMPNFQAIAANGTAQALAHLSPYAASMVGRPPPMAGYLPGGMPPTGPLLPQPTSQYLPPNNEAGAAMAGAPVGGMPIPPYAPQVNRAVGANAQIQSGVR